MLEINKITTAICHKIPTGLTFHPSETSLADYFPSVSKSNEEEITYIDSSEVYNQKVTQIVPRYPIESQVLAIDSTNFTLGHITDGLVGAIRASIVTKPCGRTGHSLERYGPYLVPVTNQNKDAIHKGTFKAIYGIETKASTPNYYDTFIIIRSWFERYIQAQAVKTCRDSFVLMDGSLIGGVVGDPTFVLRSILSDAASNGNSVIAISKSTGLTLKHTQRNVLSLLDGIRGPCYIGDIKKHISQNTDRYQGDIYVAKLTSLGEPFRIDIPRDTPVSHDEIFAQIAGLAGDYGYPEELKLAHMTCILSSIEILELQAAAIALHGLTMKEELRPKLFPL